MFKELREWTLDQWSNRTKHAWTNVPTFDEDPKTGKSGKVSRDKDGNIIYRRVLKKQRLGRSLSLYTLHHGMNHWKKNKETKKKEWGRHEGFKFDPISDKWEFDPRNGMVNCHVMTFTSLVKKKYKPMVIKTPQNYRHGTPTFFNKADTKPWPGHYTTTFMFADWVGKVGPETLKIPASNYKLDYHVDRYAVTDELGKVIGYQSRKYPVYDRDPITGEKIARRDPKTGELVWHTPMRHRSDIEVKKTKEILNPAHFPIGKMKPPKDYPYVHMPIKQQVHMATSNLRKILFWGDTFLDRLIAEGRILLHCNCMSFYWQGMQWNLAHDAIYPVTIPSKKWIHRKHFKQGKSEVPICKHLVLVLEAFATPQGKEILKQRILSSIKSYLR